MKPQDKHTVRAYGFIQKRVDMVPDILMDLRQAAGLLAEYGWFDESRIERYSRHEEIDQVRYAIGEAAATWGVSATMRAVLAFERKNAWFTLGWNHDVRQLLEAWQEKNRDQG